MLSLCTTVQCTSSSALDIMWLHFATHIPLAPYPHCVCGYDMIYLRNNGTQQRPFRLTNLCPSLIFTNSVLVFLDGFVLSPWQEGTYCFMGDKYIFHVVRSRKNESSKFNYSILLLVGFLKSIVRMFWRMKHLLWQWTPKNPVITWAEPKGLFWGNLDSALQPDSWCDDWILMKW